jgi:hypothetical protein
MRLSIVKGGAKRSRISIKQTEAAIACGEESDMLKR